MSIDWNPYASDTLSSETRLVTYQEALMIQSKYFNELNRDTSKSKINEIKGKMVKGNFIPSTTLIFSKSGVLLDGHHRIDAQVLSETDQTYIVSLGNEDSSLAHIDIGKKRTFLDYTTFILKRHNKEYTAKFIELSKEFMLGYRNSKIVNDSSTPFSITGTSMTNEQIEKMYKFLTPERVEYVVYSFIELLKSDSIYLDYFSNKGGKAARILKVLALLSINKDKEFSLNFIKSLVSPWVNSSVPIFAGPSSTVPTQWNLFKSLREEINDVRENKAFSISHAEDLISKLYIRVFNTVYAEYLSKRPNFSKLSLGKNSGIFKKGNVPGQYPNNKFTGFILIEENLENS